MDSKKINQLGTEVDPQQSDLTVIGDPISGQLKKITWLQVAHLIGAQASVTLQQVTDNGNTTTDPITTGGLTLTNLGTGVPYLSSGTFSGTYGYGLANGVATLDSGGKIPASQLPSSVMEYKGVWNASTNTPTLADGTGDNGDVYLVNVAGSQNLGSGTISFAVGDWVVYNGTIWQKSLNSNAVASVFGRTGTIVAQEGDYNIDQLGDVAITSAATNDYLRYNGSLWVNTPFPTFVSSDKLVLQVRNTSGATINKGTVVYVNGASAGYPTIAKALANADNTSAQTLGLVQDNIANNSNGVVVIVGQITGIDTSAYAAGTQLYLSGTTAGAFTSTKTLAPTHLVYVGIVTTQNAVNGVIEVKIQNGYELDEIHDVAISSVANNDGLFYESSTSLWKNKSIATILGYTPEQPLTFSSPLQRSTNTISILNASATQSGVVTTGAQTFAGNKRIEGTFAVTTSTNATTNSLPFEVIVKNDTPVAIVTTRENADGPSYFVGRCINGTYDSPTDQATYGAIFQSYGYRSGYKEQGFIQFEGANATTGGGIRGKLRLKLTDNTSTLQEVFLIDDTTATFINTIQSKDLRLTGGTSATGVVNLSSRISGIDKWGIGTVDADSATGSNFFLYTYTDAGVPTTIFKTNDRSNNSLTIGVPVSIQGQTSLTTGNLVLPANNTVGGTNYGISQSMATSDSWRIYGNSVAANQGELVFEVEDDGYPIASNGQRFRFRIGNTAGGTAKNVLILDHDISTFATQLNGTSASFSGDLTVDTNTLYVDSTNNRVGIGTTPETTFHLLTSGLSPIRLTLGSEARTHNITGVNNGRDLSILPFRSLTLQTGNGIAEGVMTLNAYEDFTIGTGSSYTARFKLDNAGSIAMGNFSPSGTPAGDYRSFEIGRQGNTITGSPFKSSLYLTTNATITAGSSTFTYRNSSTVASFLSLEGGNLTFSNAASGTAGSTITFSQAFQVTESGKTIVGKDTSNGLEVFSSGDTEIGFSYNTRGNVYAKIIGDITDASPLGGEIAFQTANSGTLTERARIIKTGYFKASNDGTYLSATAAYHEFRNDNSNFYTLIVTNKNASPASQYIQDWRFTASTPNNSNARFWNCEDATANRAYMRSDGGLGNYQANNTNLSDIRTKKEISPLESYWDKFKALEIVKFKYNDQSHDDFNIGVIAQQVESVAPEFVDVDGWGRDDENSDEPLKSVYTSDLHHATIKVLQEAMIKIEMLEAEIASLKK